MIRSVLKLASTAVQHCGSYVPERAWLAGSICVEMGMQAWRAPPFTIDAGAAGTHAVVCILVTLFSHVVQELRHVKPDGLLAMNVLRSMLPHLT